jgi:hypothetical protein
MGLTISEPMTKGSCEHPKQSYSVGKKCVDQFVRANSGNVEISKGGLATGTSLVALVALTVFSG